MGDLYEPLVALENPPPPPPGSEKEKKGSKLKIPPKKGGNSRNVADGCTAVSAVTSGDQSAYTFTPEKGPQNGIDAKDEVVPKRNKVGTVIMIISAVLMVLCFLLTVFFGIAFAVSL